MRATRRRRARLRIRPPSPAQTTARAPAPSRGPSIDWLVVGLGNPGREYSGTRHNVGFAVAEELAGRWDLGRERTRYKGRLREGRAGGARIALLEPQTYMNDVGRSVGPARGAYRIPLERVLVIHDEIDFRSATSGPASAAAWRATTG